MITVANRIYVEPEYADAFEQRFRERAGLVDKMPGFVSNQVLRPVNEGDPYVVLPSGIAVRTSSTGCAPTSSSRDTHSPAPCLRKHFPDRTCWRCTRSYRILRAPN
jgi:hypothetical protein